MKMEMNVSISKGNSKMGEIQSVSLPSGVTCGDFACKKKCYARKLERIRRTVAEAYKRNLEILQKDPEKYWREVEAAIMLSRFFRFHVSGDIPNEAYLYKMIEVADRNPHCQILCFTKRHDFVNHYLMEHQTLPTNLHIIFSGWKGLPMVNPYRLPEAHVLYRDGSTTARPDAIPCHDNCTECACTDSGCWILKAGEQVVFNEH